MPRRCTVCWHEARPEIEAMIRGKVHYSDIAGRFGVSRDAVGRHAKNHMDRAMVSAKADEIEPLQLTGTPEKRMAALATKVEEIVTRAERQSSVDTQIRGIAEARKLLELMEKIAGRMPPDTKTEILQIIMPNTCKECGRKIELHD